jgi:hypothetical protein
LFSSLLHSFGYCFHIFPFFSCFLFSPTAIHFFHVISFSFFLHSFIRLSLFKFFLSPILLVPFTCFILHLSCLLHKYQPARFRPQIQHHLKKSYERGVKVLALINRSFTSSATF